MGRGTRIENEITAEFLIAFEAHLPLIEKYVSKLTITPGCPYPLVFENNFEDIVAIVREDFGRKLTLDTFDPERGTLEAFLFHNVKNTVGTSFRAAQRHGKYLVTSSSVSEKVMKTASSSLAEGNTFELAFNGTEQNAGTLDKDLMEDLAKALDPAELDLIRAIAEEGLIGQDLYARAKKTPMQVSRLKDSIKFRIRKLLIEHGWVLQSA